MLIPERRASEWTGEDESKIDQVLDRDSFR